MNARPSRYTTTSFLAVLATLPDHDRYSFINYHPLEVSNIKEFSNLVAMLKLLNRFHPKCEVAQKLRHLISNGEQLAIILGELNINDRSKFKTEQEDYWNKEDKDQEEKMPWLRDLDVTKDPITIFRKI